MFTQEGVSVVIVAAGAVFLTLMSLTMFVIPGCYIAPDEPGA